MKTLVIDRSTEHTSVVGVEDDGTIVPVDLGIWPRAEGQGPRNEGQGPRNEGQGPRAEGQGHGEFHNENSTIPQTVRPSNCQTVKPSNSQTVKPSNCQTVKPSNPQTIIVGTGPGSFAGIRSALAYAQGCAVGSGCEVLGLTSAAAFARSDEPVAVVGDARRGKFWIALFDGYRLVTDVFQVEREGLVQRVPRGVTVLSPDWRRIGPILTEEFGEDAAPAPELDAAALWRAATANPSLLRREPLPIYLNPAVRQ